MNEEYIRQCSEFEWLQKRWRPKIGDIVAHENTLVIIYMFNEHPYKKEDDDPFWCAVSELCEWSNLTRGGGWVKDCERKDMRWIPTLTDLIELLGNRLLSIQRRTENGLFSCNYIPNKAGEITGSRMTDDCELPELACLHALMDLHAKDNDR